MVIQRSERAPLVQLRAVDVELDQQIGRKAEGAASADTPPTPDCTGDGRR